MFTFSLTAQSDGCADQVSREITREVIPRVGERIFLAGYMSLVTDVVHYLEEEDSYSIFVKIPKSGLDILSSDPQWEFHDFF